MSRKKRRAPSVDDLRPFEQTAVLTTLVQRADAVGEAVREERRKGTAEREAMLDQLATYCPRWQRDYT